MDEVERLGELLDASKRHEEHKRQQFQAGLAHWESSILALYQQIERWLAPLESNGQLTFDHEPYLAQSVGYPDEHSPFHTQRLTLGLAGRQVVFVPDAMGAKGKGLVSIVVIGLSLNTQEQITLTLAPSASDWELTKRIGLKESSTHVFTVEYFARQLQTLVPPVSV